MKVSIKACLLAVTALVPATAFAQAAPATDDSVNADIIVTARKFEEKLQNAPTTVAVATAAQIENLNLTSVADIAKTTPGLVLDDSFGRSGNSRPVIRGQANILGESGVAFFIDGIYYSGSLSDYDVDSIERIEVVKGPQSALYGRNTYSGAINIISKMPGDHWQGQVQADIGERERYEVSAGIRGPIADGLGIAISGRYYYNKGDFINTYDNSRIGKEQTSSILGLLKYDNGGPVRFSLRGNYNRTRDGQPALFSQGANANNCYPDNGATYRGQGRYYCGVVVAQPISSDYSRQFVDPENVGFHGDTFNGAFRADFDLSDNLTLTSLTGYNSYVADSKTDGDYSPFNYQTTIFAYTSSPIAGNTTARNRQYTVLSSGVNDFTNSSHTNRRDWSQELRLQFTSDRVKAILGGYYFHQNNDSYDTRVQPTNALALAQTGTDIALAYLCQSIANCGGVTPITRTLANLPGSSRNTNFYETTNKAIFGSLTFNFTDTLSLSAEGRYAEEEVTQVTQTYNLGATPPAAATVSATFKKFSPRITLDWQATPNNLFYAIFAKGQKPGGFNSNTAIVAGFPTYDPENNESYEIGAKNSFLGGKLIANVALFHNLITGYQITQNVSVPPNQVSLTRNGGDATIDGFELSVTAKPDRHVTLTANYAYTNAKFTAGTDENLGLIFDVADDGLVNCSTGDQFPTVTGCQSLFGSIVGKSIPRAPMHTAFVDLDYHGPKWNNGWQFFAGANVTLTSTSFDQVLNFAKTGGSAIVDGRLGFQNENFKVQLYVRNATDDASVQQILRYADINADLRRNFVAGQRPPRRIGVVFQAKF